MVLQYDASHDTSLVRNYIISNIDMSLRTATSHKSCCLNIISPFDFFHVITVRPSSRYLSDPSLYCIRFILYFISWGKGKKKKKVSLLDILTDVSSDSRSTL